MTLTRQEAKAKGLTRYSTGKPCKNGHLAEKFVSNYLCVECAKMQGHLHRERHPDIVATRHRRYYEANRERYTEYDRRYKAANRQLLRDRAKARLARFGEEIRARKRAARAANPEEARAAKRQWYASTYASRVPDPH
jgi:hypothetical protein